MEKEEIESPNDIDDDEHQEDQSPEPVQEEAKPKGRRGRPPSQKKVDQPPPPTTKGKKGRPETKKKEPAMSQQDLAGLTMIDSQFDLGNFKNFAQSQDPNQLFQQFNIPQLQGLIQTYGGGSQPQLFDFNNPQYAQYFPNNRSQAPLNIDPLKFLQQQAAKSQNQVNPQINFFIPGPQQIFPQTQQQF